MNNNSASIGQDAWKHVKPLVYAPFELLMMIAMVSSLSIFSKVEPFVREYLPKKIQDEHSLDNVQDLANNPTRFMISQISKTRSSNTERKRQTYWVSKAGSLHNLAMAHDYIDTPEAIPSDDLTSLLAPQGYQVQIDVKAIGLNMADIFAVQGLYSATPEGEFIPGLEFSGVVSALSAEYEEYVSSGAFDRQEDELDRAYLKNMLVIQGKKIPDFSKDGIELQSFFLNLKDMNLPRRQRNKPLKVGDRVMGLTRFGAYSTIINADTRVVRHLPSDWSFADGASLLVQGLTATYGLLKLGKTKKDDTVLIHSAAGGVGLCAMEICRNLGAYPIATVGSPKKAVYLLKKFGSELHINQVIDRSICGTGSKNPFEPLQNLIDSTVATVDGRLREDELHGETDLLLTALSPILRLTSFTTRLTTSALSPIAIWFKSFLCKREICSDDFGLAIDKALKAISAAKKAKNNNEFASNLNSNVTDTGVITWNLMRDKVAVQALKNTIVSSKTAKKDGEKSRLAIKSPSMIRGIDVVMDSLLGYCFEPTIERLAPEARVLVFGAATYSTPNESIDYSHIAWEYIKRPLVDPMALTSKNISIQGFNLIWLWSRLEEFGELYDVMRAYLISKPTIGKTFSFKQLKKGLAYLQSGDSVGKVVITLED